MKMVAMEKMGLSRSCGEALGKLEAVGPVGREQFMWSGVCVCLNLIVLTQFVWTRCLKPSIAGLIGFVRLVFI